MNQILCTEETFNKIEKQSEVPKRVKVRTVSKREGMVLISILFIIIILVITILNLSSFQACSQAAAQNENMVIEQVEENINKEEDIPVQIDVVEQKKEEVPETKQPITKQVTTSNGKSYSTIAYLNIPSLGIEYPVLSSTSTELLKVSLNKYWGANPNEVGNMCIVGHNYNDSRFFGKLNKIKIGAEIKLTDMTEKTLTYKVYHTKMVDPYDTQCTSQLTNGNIEITLITCNYDGSERFVVKARVE